MEKTTIQISQNTLERLKNLKKYERQSYDDILNGMINDIEEETLSEEEISGIKTALDNVKEGKIKSIERVAEELGVVLK